jgi:peptide/nickel transport system permease protein
VSIIIAPENTVKRKVKLGNFIVKRLLLTVLVLVMVSFFSFGLLQIMPGDPAATMLGMTASPAQIKELRHELWLDRPFLVQYGHWAWNIMQGNLGESLTFREPISGIITDRLPITLYISFFAILLSIVLGIAMGIICAIRRGGMLDQLISVIANVGYATPVFWLGIIGIYFFGFKLGWLPIQGWTSPLDDFVQSTKAAVMPITLLAIRGIATMARQTRSSMLEVISQDYIRTAFSKGLRERTVILRHALKNSLIPVVTLIGMQVRILVGGSVLVEQVFNIPGMGRLLVDGAINKDFLVVQAGVLIIGAIVCLVNLLVDISYGWLDHRVRYE